MTHRNHRIICIYLPLHVCPYTIRCTPSELHLMLWRKACWVGHSRAESSFQNLLQSGITYPSLSALVSIISKGSNASLTQMVSPWATSLVPALSGPLGSSGTKPFAPHQTTCKPRGVSKWVRFKVNSKNVTSLPSVTNIRPCIAR